MDRRRLTHHVRSRSLLLRILVCIVALNTTWVCAWARTCERPRIARHFQRLSQPVLTVPSLSLLLEANPEPGDAGLLAPNSGLTLGPVHRPCATFSFPTPTPILLPDLGAYSAARAPPIA
jgi:hypothetical protein